MPVLMQRPLLIASIIIPILAFCSGVLELAYANTRDAKERININFLETFANLSIFALILSIFLSFLVDGMLKGLDYIAFLAGLLVFGYNTLKCLKRLKSLNKKK